RRIDRDDEVIDDVTTITRFKGGPHILERSTTDVGSKDVSTRSREENLDEELHEPQNACRASWSPAEPNTYLTPIGDHETFAQDYDITNAVMFGRLWYLSQ